MHTHSRLLCLFALVASVVCFTAQGQQAGAADARLPAPTIFPAPGTYFNTTSLSLMDAVPGTEIHYTWDGSEPNASSPLFDPHGVLFIAGLYDGNKGLKTGYTLRAVAMKAGVPTSEPVTFSYLIDRRDRTAYVSEEVAPGVRMIRDSDNDKMFLIRGTKSYALVDSGMGRGALRDYISQFTGGLPLVAIWTHSHGDHIGQADQFIAGSTEYVGEADRQAVADFLERHGASREQIAEHLESVRDGSKIDLGDRALEIITVPGHTPGSIVVFDPASGNLFTGDTFGNNSYLPPDVLWMQWPNQPPLDRYFAAVRTARAMLGDRVKRIMTGHNDHPLVGTKYLDNLETALQRAMDEGNAALVPSYRPPGLRQIVVGDRFTDPNWFGVNVNARTFLPAPPDQITSLTIIDVKGAALTQRFEPTLHDYRAIVSGATHGPITISIRPASSRVQSLTIDGKAVRPGVPYKVSFKGQSKTVPIVITAHDGKTTDTYRLTLATSAAPPAANATQATSTPFADAEQTRAEITAVENLLPKIADRGAALYFLARRYAHLGDLAKATDLLKECMALEAGFDPGDSPSLQPLRANPAVVAMTEHAKQQYPAVQHARVAVEIPATDLFPEGLAVDAADGTFYMGSMHHKKIVTFTLAGGAKDFVKEGPYDLMPVGGVHVDPADHSVWATTDAGVKQQPELLHFDRTGRLLERYPSPGKMPFDLNDSVLRGSQEIFTTDTEGSHVYRFDRRAHTFTELKLFRPVFYPNGITLSADQHLLYVADILGVIRVDLQTNESVDVEPGPRDTLSGVDGLYWYKGDLVGVQYGTGEYRVMRWRLSPDGRKVTEGEVLEYRTAMVDDPTTGAIYRDGFYYIANSGINNLQNDRIVDPAKLTPVHIAYLPLE